MKKRLLTVLLAVCLVLAMGTISALADDDTPVVQIGNETYTSLYEAMEGSEFGANDTLVLLADCSTSWLKIPNNSVIDLNGHDLTYTGTTTVTFSGAIGSGNEASIIDSSVSGSEIGGSLIIDGERPDGVASVFEIINTTLNVRNIRVQSTGCVFFPKGSDAELNITNCDITTSGVFCVSTNAGSQANYGVTINILNSSLTANSNNKDDCGIMMNVSGTLNIENSTITGNRQGVIARAGDVNIVNSEITVTGAWAEQSGNDADKYYDSDWQSGNETPSAAIVIGNRNGTYFADADVNINDSKIVSKNDDLSAMHVDATTTAQGESEVKYASYVSITGSDTVVTGDITSNAQDSADKSIEIAVTGGTYDSDVSAYIQAGAALTQDESGKIVEDTNKTIVARVDGIGFTDLASAIAAADSGDTVEMLADETGPTDLNLWIPNGVTLDLGGNTLTAGYQIAIGYKGNTTATVKNGTLIGSSVAAGAAYNAGGSLTLDQVTVISRNDYCAVQNNSGNITLIDCMVYGNNGGGIYDFGTKSSVTLKNSDVTGSNFAVYHNGSTAGFTLTAENSTIIGDSDVACAIYVSGSTTSTDRDGMNSINLTGCTVTGPTGIEGKYTNMVLTNCDITATAEPNFEQNNNGTTALGFAVVSTDNSMDPNSPAPKSDITINGGAYDGIVGLGQYEDIDNYEGFQESDYTVTGGSFANPLPSEYLDDSLNAELYSRSNSDTPYSYYSTVEDAMDAAQPGDIVTDLSEVTSDTRYNVTFNYGNNDSETVSVSAGATITFTAPTRSGYEFRGWRDGSGELHKAGDVVTVNSDMTFTAVWSAINIPDTYDIEIADTANGEVDTSLSNASAGSTITITATPDSGYSVASVTVTGPDGRVDVVRVNATTYTFKMPAGDVTVRVTFTDSDALPFTDVSAGQWFYDAVAYVYTNGMMEGDSATTFNPDGTMTRAMFWAVLGRIDGATITGTNWADRARDWAMAEGVSDGTDPNGLVTREQMVTMLWRYAGEPESTASLSAYTDADSVSDWAETAMRWAIDEGIITGMTDTTLVPQGTATRAQCAAIFMRFDQM